MRTIQEVGTEILNNEPKSFYVFGGSEYGIKLKYLDILKQHYGDAVVETSSMQEIISLFSTKHFIPLKPTLYIVRYDEEFVSSLNESSANKLKSLKIIGTVICLYESSKSITKLDKFLPDNVVQIDNINKQFIVKYLHSDFPNLPDKLINLAANYSENYGDAQHICACMQTIPVESLFALSDKEIAKLFGKQDIASEKDLKVGIASRNFSYLIKLTDQYEDVDSIFYIILNTMLEIEKILTNKYAQSDIREYEKRWTLEDMYNMFMNTYEMIRKSRSSQYSGNTKDNLVYLFSLLKFEKVPDMMLMEEG